MVKIELTSGEAKDLAHILTKYVASNEESQQIEKMLVRPIITELITGAIRTKNKGLPVFLYIDSKDQIRIGRNAHHNVTSAWKEWNSR